MANERTPLTGTMEGTSGPSYVYPTRIRQRQVKQLQCCICAAFLAVFTIALIITISYSVMDDDNNIIPTDLSTLQPPSSQMTTNTTNDTDIGLLFLIQWPVDDESESNWNFPNITKDDQMKAIEMGKKALGDKEILEETMSSPAHNSPSFKHQRAVSTTKEARTVSKRGFVENHATKWIVNKHNYETKNKKRWNVGRGPKINFDQPKPEVTCDFNSKYRTANGSCNNQNYPLGFGVAMLPFRRHLNPDYSDGVSAPRKAKDGSDLPSARQISIQVHRPSYKTDPNFTVMLAVWGQFLDHDITATAGTQGDDGKPIECCDNDEVSHPECFPVKLEKGDPYFEKYNLTCMNFVRSAPAPTGRFGPREQLNQASAFIDGSVVYSANEDRMNVLREKDGGRLRMYTTPDNRTLLPISTDPNDGCNEIEMNKKGHYCFESGDARGNENLHLTSMHLLWARHHNFLARNLERINPNWNDEKIFQEARKILGAQMQHITYNEFLPIVLGDNLTNEIGLNSNDGDLMMDDVYDKNVNPSIANSFAAAAFRFAHTLIPGLMKATKDVNTPEGIALHKMLFNPYSLWENKGLDNAIGGAMITQLAKSDPYFTSELSERLFENPIPTPGHLCGLDLVSLNIQRGRDHGLPGYSEFRKHCKLTPVETWEQLSNVADNESFAMLKTIFKSPQDIDVYSGALSEPPMLGAITGPLLACLVSDQFYRLKFGDSFWYERKSGPQRFRSDQLKQIYNTTLASIICQNSDNVAESQKYLMRVVDKDNPLIACSELNNFDFKPWTSSESRMHLVKVNEDDVGIRSISIDNNNDDKKHNDIVL